MKTCTKCKELKPLSDFYTEKRALDNKTSACSQCLKSKQSCYFNSNKNKVTLSNKSWQSRNIEKVRAYKAKWSKSNPEIKKQHKIKHRKSATYINTIRKYIKENKLKLDQSRKAWNKSNPDKKRAQWYRYQTKKSKAAPSWLTDQHWLEIQEYYKLAKELQWLAEEPLEVDHIIPLQGKNVSGLHVPWNLQILPRSLNRSKLNKY